MKFEKGTLVNAFERGSAEHPVIGVVLEASVNRNVSAGYVMYSHIHRVLFTDGSVQWKDEHQLVEVV